jgi:xanthine/uracil permease
MAFWLREIAGWLLLAAGVLVFVVAYQMLLARRVLDVIPLCFIGFVVFRGGLHLIKVAVAARAVRDLRVSASESRRPSV